MTKLIQITGDIFVSTAPAFGHGVNTSGVMGSGIAVPVRETYGEEMYLEYQKGCKNGYLKPGGWMGWYDPDLPYLYNIASQDKPGAHARYGWLESGVHSALEDAAYQGFDRLALPRIGAGVGGLQWEKVLAILEQLAAETSVDIELWSLPNA